MAIGDITSDAKGSGARFNDGKAPVEYIPLRLLATQIGTPNEVRTVGVRDTLFELACWQEGAGFNSLIAAYKMLGDLREVVFEEARVFEYGTRKYAVFNWAKGMSWTAVLACATRHLLAMDAGEALDPESGLPHRGHVACNIRMLMHYVDHYPEGDDRPAALRAG